MEPKFSEFEIDFIRAAFTSAYNNCAYSPVTVAIELFADDFDRDITKEVVYEIVYNLRNPTAKDLLEIHGS